MQLTALGADTREQLPPRNWGSSLCSLGDGGEHRLIRHANLLADVPREAAGASAGGRGLCLRDIVVGVWDLFRAGPVCYEQKSEQKSGQ